MFETFFAKLAGKFLSKKLELKEGSMEGVKAWYLSKNIWNNVVTGLVGIYLGLIQQGVHLPAIPAWFIALLSAVGIYTRVTATDKIG